MAYLQAQITTQAVIQTDEGKILLLRRNKPEGWFTLPGGTVEEGEAVLDALKREITEETGLQIEIGRPLWVWQSNHIGKDLLGIVFLTVDYVPVDKTINLSKEHDSFRWFTLDELFSNEDVDPYIKKEELKQLTR